jgi:hypothetical protein
VTNLGASKAVSSRRKRWARDEQAYFVLAGDFGNGRNSLVHVIGKVVISTICRNPYLRRIAQ